jgi:hypothetical protein
MDRFADDFVKSHHLFSNETPYHGESLVSDF